MLISSLGVVSLTLYWKINKDSDIEDGNNDGKSNFTNNDAVFISVTEPFQHSYIFVTHTV